MLDFPRWKIISLHLLLVLAVVFALPSVLPASAMQYWPSFIPKESVNLGLDLSGGSHILLEADPSQVGEIRVEKMADSVRTAMRRAERRIKIGDISTRGQTLSFVVEDVAQVDEAREEVNKLTSGAGLTGQRDWNIQIVDDKRFILTPTKEGLDIAVDTAMDSATDVIRRRIDGAGTKEPTIIRQSTNRIVVQVPGLDDPEELKVLLGQTAKLEFRLVDQTADVANGQAPVGSMILPMADGSGTIAVKRAQVITGDTLTSAQQSFDQNGQAVVSITFDTEGGRRFARLTQENVGKPFAIILDGKVISAPNIEEPILGGASQISGGFTVEEASQLAISLSSGALPVDLKVVEERSVGPDLGADSIKKGGIASIVATSAVLVFMFVTYGRFGLYANLALALNLAMILAVMALMNSTLTLPGIAGFVLTVGAAVDANVLINERIREERRRGRKIIDAIDTGYREASRAIFDANVTNVIAGVLLFWFGSGPIRGFAVVLMIGIVTSVFTAVVITRMWVSMWLKSRPKELNI